MTYFHISQTVFFFLKVLEYCLLSLSMFNEYYNRFPSEMWGGFLYNPKSFLILVMSLLDFLSHVKHNTYFILPMSG